MKKELIKFAAKLFIKRKVNKMENEKYVDPEMKITKFEQTEVITISYFPGPGHPEDEW